jgi:hypothetical protein
MQIWHGSDFRDLQITVPPRRNLGRSEQQRPSPLVRYSRRTGPTGPPDSAAVYADPMSFPAGPGNKHAGQTTRHLSKCCAHRRDLAFDPRCTGTVQLVAGFDGSWRLTPPLISQCSARRNVIMREVMGVGSGVYNGIETTRGRSAITPYTAMTFAVSGGFGHEADKRDRGVARRTEIPPVADSSRRSDLAVVPEIDHRVGEGLECVVQPADTLEAQQ